MSAKRLIGGALILIGAVGAAYTIQGAFMTVWGVSQYDETPVTVKLFIPFIVGMLIIVGGGMALTRYRRKATTPPVAAAGPGEHPGAR